MNVLKSVRLNQLIVKTGQFLSRIDSFSFQEGLRFLSDQDPLRLLTVELRVQDIEGKQVQPHAVRMTCLVLGETSVEESAYHIFCRVFPTAVS